MHPVPSGKSVDCAIRQQGSASCLQGQEGMENRRPSHFDRMMKSAHERFVAGSEILLNWIGGHNSLRSEDGEMRAVVVVALLHHYRREWPDICYECIGSVLRIGHGPCLHSLLPVHAAPGSLQFPKSFVMAR